MALPSGLVLVALIAAESINTFAAAGRVTISNLKPRLSTTGEIVNAHDGTVRWFDGKWYMHAAQYGECADPPHHGCEMTGPTRSQSCGFHPNHNVSTWTSPDLSSGSWEFVGHAMQCTQAPNCGILYRPHLVWNPNTNLYVLFWNYVNKAGKYAGDAAATAKSPAGPFTIASPLINTTYPTGDFDVFVDKDGTGYMIYGDAHLNFIEKLTPDFLHGTGIGADIPGGKPYPVPPPPPAKSPLSCPPGHKLDIVDELGDNGSCDCEEFCASDWSTSLNASRPHWTGATSAVPGAKTNCQCVQASHWCPVDKSNSKGCSSACDKLGVPRPQNFCVPGQPPAPTPSPHAPSKPLVAFPVDFVEAPVLFERKGIYYALFGHCCCFCYQGSGMFVFQAPHPLGPWTQQGYSDLGCVNGTTPVPGNPSWGSKSLPLTAIPQPGQGCLYNNAKQASVTRAQQNFVVQVENGDGETEYIWTGDRWMQAPDGIKGHEPQFWGRLEFDEAGDIQPLRWVDEITIDMKQP